MTLQTKDANGVATSLTTPQLTQLQTDLGLQSAAFQLVSAFDAAGAAATAQTAAIAAAATAAAAASVSTIAAPASGALTTANAGQIIVNTTSNSYTYSLVPGLKRIVLEQTSTGTLTVIAGTAAVSGATATTLTQPIITLVETTPGVYVGQAGAIFPLAATSLGGILDAASKQSLTASGFTNVARGSVALFGDSRNAQQTAGNTTRIQTSLNWFNRFQAMSGQSLKLIGKYAVSGVRTDALAGQIATALAAPVLPQYGIIHIGLNNYGNTTVLAAATDIANACASLIAAGITPIVFNEPGGTSVSGVAGMTWLFELRERIMDMVDNDRRITMFDPAATMWEPAAAGWTQATPVVTFKTGYLLDGTHTSNLGAYYLGQAFYNWFANRIIPFEQRSITTGEMVNANNPLALIQNGMFMSTTGGATSGAGTLSSGTVPAGWTFYKGAVASTSTAITYSAGTNGNDLVLAVTTSAADTVKILQDVNSTIKNAMTIGQMNQAECEIVVTGATNLMGVHLIHEYNDGTATTNYIDGYAGLVTDPIPPGPGPAAFGPDLLKPPVMVLSTLPTAWCTVRIEAVFSGAGSATITVRRVSFRKRLL